MSTSDCIFCKIVAGEISSVKIYEDDAVLSFLDIGPVSDGHTLVIPKMHYERLDLCPPDIASRIGATAAMLAPAVQKAAGAQGYNVLCNNGRSAGQLVNHVHFHIIPRKLGDGVFNHWPSYAYKPGQIDKIAAAIRNNL